MDRRQAGSGQMRRGGRSPTSSTQTPITIFGSNLVEYWDARYGYSLNGSDIDSWTGLVLGTVATAPAAGQRPAFGADGSNFRGLPVVQCARATSKYLDSGDLGSPLLASGTRPYMIAVGRNRANPAAGDHHPWWQLRETVATEVVNISTQAKEDTGTVGFVAYTRNTGNTGDWYAPTAIDVTVPCAIEHFMRADGVHLVRDGTEISHVTEADAQRTLDASVSVVRLGSGTYGVSNASLAAFIICAAEPSAAERTAILAWSRATWGTT